MWGFFSEVFINFKSEITFVNVLFLLFIGFLIWVIIDLRKVVKAERKALAHANDRTLKFVEEIKENKVVTKELATLIKLMCNKVLAGGVQQ